MSIIESLPSNSIYDQGPASRAFLSYGCPDFHHAAQTIWKLPYGRNSAPDELLVLDEGQGTCSTKHGLLARCANELGLEVELVLGIYLLTPEHSPEIASILRDAELDSLPEAHCILRCSGSLIDLTFSGEGKRWSPAEFMAYETIRAEDVHDYKKTIHRLFIDGWSLRHHTDLRAAEIWTLRERCVMALAQSDKRQRAPHDATAQPASPNGLMPGGNDRETQVFSAPESQAPPRPTPAQKDRP